MALLTAWLCQLWGNSVYGVWKNFFLGSLLQVQAATATAVVATLMHSFQNAWESPADNNMECLEPKRLEALSATAAESYPRTFGLRVTSEPQGKEWMPRCTHVPHDSHAQQIIRIVWTNSSHLLLQVRRLRIFRHKAKAEHEGWGGVSQHYWEGTRTEALRAYHSLLQDGKTLREPWSS